MRARFPLPRTTVSQPDPVGSTVPAIIAASGVVFVGLLAWSRFSGQSLSPATWYLTRAAGLSLYVVLWATVALGLGMTTRTIARLGMRKSVIYSLHGYLTGLSYGFLALHLISLAADPFSHYSLAQMLIPFRNPWREPWTGFGVIAAYLTVLLGSSFALRRITGFRAWRAMHWLTFILYLMALAHGLGSGSDTGTWWARLLYAATAGSIAWLVIVRVRHGRRRDTPLLAPTSVPFDRFAPRPRPARPPASAPAVTAPRPATPMPVRAPAPALAGAARPQPAQQALRGATLYLGHTEQQPSRNEDLDHWRAAPLTKPVTQQAPAGVRRAVPATLRDLR